MLILHGSWLAAEPPRRGFLVWGETDVARAMATRAQSRLHPFSASARTLRDAVSTLEPAAGLPAAHAGAAAAHLWLPSRDNTPLPSSPLLQLESSGDGRAPELEAWSAEALRLENDAVLAFLTALPGPDDETPGIVVGADLNFWRAAGRFALELIARQRFMPVLLEHDGQFLALWKPQLEEPVDRARFDQLVRAMPPACRALTPRATHEPSALTPRALLEHFFETQVDGFARRHAAVRRIDLKSGLTPVAALWLAALNDADPRLQAPTTDLRAFYEQYHAWADPLSVARDGAPSQSSRLCFRLDPPAPSATQPIHLPDPQAREWQLSYFLQATDDPSLLIPAAQVWKTRGSTLRLLKRAWHAPQEQLLAGLGHASRLFPPIETSLQAAQPTAAALTAGEAYSFLRETALLLQSFGFGVLVPGLNTKLGVKVRLKAARPTPPKGGVAAITLDELVNYDWQLALGDSTLTRAEFDALAALKTPLVQIRGRWVELRPEQLQAALKFWEKQQRAGEISAEDALRLALTLDPGTEDAGLPVTEVVAEGWIGDLLATLREGATLERVPVPPSFHGTLREYQADGLAWLAFLRRWALGGILADDMGLGKTPQTIALLLHARAQAAPDRPTLVICPTSVVSNWQRELERFAPGLRVYAHHGARRLNKDLAAEAARHDIVLSSYSLLQRDEKHLTAVVWDNAILDEAQFIKNPSTKQARAARKLNAAWRLILTGTPVENRLGELWSLFQFLNPGYLGSREDFQRRFANPIERGGDERVTAQLRQLTAPFILRRVKTDPQVIRDLPAKNEMTVVVNLTREQATLYEAVVRDSLRRIDEAEGIERRGIVLGMITRLKQVCNHPAQFLGDQSALAGRSGKLMQLTEMLEQVRAVHERALVFTQFAEMGHLLQSYLQETLASQVLFLYGGTPAQKRTEMIDRFQNEPHGPPVLLLSLKAGGTGLNLTRANHVFHYDRWWNPAVENQATDRAFRIGQTKNVQVYKYICAGTFEEQIDAMLKRKQALAEKIVGGGEGWVTELSTAELRRVFELRRDAVAD